MKTEKSSCCLIPARGFHFCFTQNSQNPQNLPGSSFASLYVIARRHDEAIQGYILWIASHCSQ